MKKIGKLAALFFVAAALALAAGRGYAQIDLLSNDKLIEAAKANDLSTAETLLERKHNVEVRDQERRAPMHIAATQGDEDFVDLLLRFKAKPNIQDKFGNTPLYYAAAGDHIGVIEILMEAGAKADIQNRQGVTPLMVAASEGNLGAVQTLFDKKADPAVTDFTGRTAFDWAQRNNRRAVIRFLKSAGAGS